ncbi:ABC transporter substrate-binding protein [Corynebacterium nasicanis]|uniref:ABC transporter substrate-binding protein n=1 Tax=Corynebacterium nasicanis TaxID=1448267 RepID=A0ABW1QG96_9CORY
MISPRILVPLLLTGALGLGACSSPSNADDLGSLTLNVGDQIAGTEKVLAAAGELADVPYDISWSAFTSGPPQIEALNAAQIDFAITGNTPPVLGGNTDTTVITAYSNPAEGDAILLRPDSDITSVAELAGRSVAVARGSSAHGHLILQLEKAGVLVEDVTINYLPPSDGKAAFESGQVDAWAVWDPYTALAELDGAVPLVTAAGVSNGFGFGVASDAALEDPLTSRALADFTARVERAYAWARENPSAWAQVYATETRVDVAAAELNNRSLRTQIPLDERVVSSQNDLIGAFHRAGILPTGFDFADKIDTRFEENR